MDQYLLQPTLKDKVLLDHSANSSLMRNILAF